MDINTSAGVKHKIDESLYAMRKDLSRSHLEKLEVVWFYVTENRAMFDCLCRSDVK